MVEIERSGGGVSLKLNHRWPKLREDGGPLPSHCCYKFVSWFASFVKSLKEPALVDSLDYIFHFCFLNFSPGCGHLFLFTVFVFGLSLFSKVQRNIIKVLL